MAFPQCINYVLVKLKVPSPWFRTLPRSGPPLYKRESFWERSVCALGSSQLTDLNPSHKPSVGAELERMKTHLLSDPEDTNAH